jgi:gas vesicle structural protein
MAAIQKSTDSSSLAEVISIILDKGIVIDAWATVSLVGIQLLAIEARVVIASVETYLKYAAALGLTAGHEKTALPMSNTVNVAAAAPAAVGA